jgi:hypothetical protein
MYIIRIEIYQFINLAMRGLSVVSPTLVVRDIGKVTEFENYI